MTKIELVSNLSDSAGHCRDSFNKLDTTLAFQKSEEKWSRAEHVQHLILSAKPLLLAFNMPAFVLQIMFGKANRPSRTYDELQMKYTRKLAEGGKASGPYIPKPLNTGSNKTQLIESFTTVHQKLIAQINTWREDQLDKFVLPHPLLGKLTLREMIYFTIIHIRHHEKAIKN